MNSKSFLAAFLSVSLATSMLFVVLPVSANENPTPITIDENYRQQWIRLETDLITILFPANGRKPMFLWWYRNDTDVIYVMKYKGLAEFLTFDAPYYLRRYEADGLTIQERLEARYGTAGPQQTYILNRIRAYFGELLGLHPPLLPFGACEWNLTGPELIPKGNNVYCVSFNFTLVKAPSTFSFAENNVVIRCRFYNGSVEESAGTYSYTVGEGQMKMDLVVKNWTWNIDRLQPLIAFLSEEYDVSIPPYRTGLALWINLASINLKDLPVAENDIANAGDNAVETVAGIRAAASSMVFSGRRHRITLNNLAAGMDERPLALQYRLKRFFRMHFAEEDRTLAGFFSFVSTANVLDPTTGETTQVNVTASYIAAGGHMRLFIGYPYFGNQTLEHDPLIGAELLPSFITPGLVLSLIVASGAIAAVVFVAKWKRKPLNMVGAN